MQFPLVNAQFARVFKYNRQFSVENNGRGDKKTHSTHRTPFGKKLTQLSHFYTHFESSISYMHTMIYMMLEMNLLLKFVCALHVFCQRQDNTDQRTENCVKPNCVQIVTDRDAEWKSQCRDGNSIGY